MANLQRSVKRSSGIPGSRIPVRITRKRLNLIEVRLECVLKSSGQMTCVWPIFHLDLIMCVEVVIYS
jgi:hypothetical protein